MKTHRQKLKISLLVQFKFHRIRYKKLYTCPIPQQEKGHKLKTATAPVDQQGMVMSRMYMHQLDTFYKSYGFENIIWSHRGQNLIFTKMLKLIHVTQYNHKILTFLRTVYLWYGANVNLGSFGIQWGQNAIKFVKGIRNSSNSPIAT